MLPRAVQHSIPNFGFLPEEHALVGVKIGVTAQGGGAKSPISVQTRPIQNSLTINTNSHLSRMACLIMSMISTYPHPALPALLGKYQLHFTKSSTRLAQSHTFHVMASWNPGTRSPGPPVLPTSLTRSPLWDKKRRHSAGGRALILDVMCISINGRQPAHQVWAHTQLLQFFQILRIREIMGSLTASAKLAFPL